MPWAPTYITVEEFRAYQRVDDAIDDAAMAWAVEAASRTVDREANRQFGQVDAPEARYFTAWLDQSLRRWVVDIDDVMDTTGLAIGYDATDSGVYDAVTSAYRLHPVNAAAKGRPWTRLVLAPGGVGVGCADYGVEVTALWGWSAVPEPIRQATALQASRFLARRDSPYGVAGSSDAGTEIRLLARADPDVAVTVKPYRRLRVAR